MSGHLRFCFVVFSSQVSRQHQHPPIHSTPCSIPLPPKPPRPLPLKRNACRNQEAGGIGSFSGELERRHVQAISEALADAYLDGAENSEDEARVEMLQGLAEKALARLAWLGSLT